MSRLFALARGRAAAERGMTDTCTIRRRTGEAEGAGGVITPTYATVYTGPCRVQVRAEAGNQTDIGQASVIVTRTELQLPIAATGLQEGDQATIDSALSDPDLAGNVYAVRDVLTKSEATARRLVVVAVTS